MLEEAKLQNLLRTWRETRALATQTKATKQPVLVIRARNQIVVTSKDAGLRSRRSSLPSSPCSVDFWQFLSVFWSCSLVFRGLRFLRHNCKENGKREWNALFRFHENTKVQRYMLIPFRGQAINRDVQFSVDVIRSLWMSPKLENVPLHPFRGFIQIHARLFMSAYGEPVRFDWQLRRHRWFWFLLARYPLGDDGHGSLLPIFNPL